MRLTLSTALVLAVLSSFLPACKPQTRKSPAPPARPAGK
jgi:hypothetical protein